MYENIKPSFKNLDYIVEENRRKTFKKWVFSDKDVCNADKMAEAGFIFIGNRSEPDAVKCFLCSKSLDGWDPTDDPWQEHLKHSPNCQFAQLQKSEENLTVKEILDILNKLTEMIINSYFDKKAEEIEAEFEEYEQKIMDRLKKI